MRLAFMGTPACVTPVLEAVRQAGHKIAAVYSAPPRRAGRGRALRPPPVACAARAQGLELRAPESLKSPEEQARFAALNLDAAVVAAYGRILPPAMLAAPRFGCFNLHPSLLPRWRGAAPVERALMAGDRQTGIAVIQMDEGLDTGDVLLSERVEIAEGITGGELKACLFRRGGGLIVRVLADCAQGRLRPTPQGACGMTYAAPIAAEETQIDWQESALLLARKIQALAPQPGAWTTMRAGGEKSQRLRILSASWVAQGAAPPGRVLDPALPLIACGQGALRLEIVQRPGRRAMRAEAFLRGAALPSVLGG